MAEGNSPKGGAGVFTKKVQRKLSRSKEKVLQRLGKTVESRDDIFDSWLNKFQDQQSDGNRIYKDLKIYLSAVRDMRSASRRLSQSLFDAYETDWAGDEELGAIVEGEDLLWNDYEVKLSDQALRTMESYMGQFPDVRDRISKRGRKLVDYDHSLHQLESLQAAKKRDDVKIAKAEEELSAAKYVYEAINTELKDDLPAFHESRIGCYVSVFSAVSSLRDIFHKEMSTLNTDLQNVMKDLTLQHPGQVFTLKGVQRYGSLKRRSLMSPKSWKSSFSDFHQGYSPKIGTQRFSFRSPDKPRHGTLTRESSGGVSDGDGARSPPAEVLSSEFRDEETESLRSDADSCVADAQQQPGSGGLDAATGGAAQEPKAEDDQTGGGEEEKSVDADGEAEADPASQSQQEDKGQGDTSALSESSSELNRSFDSESLDMQLSSVANGTLYIEEKEDAQSNGVAVAALGSKEVSQKVSSSGDAAESDTY
ncbi:Bridging integrator 2 [Merluccius polli]|uniref:Bridging integrator 2 n=1 Tax=Merluccius polli TaxID=89951 RepID=A0AA47P576_MERPO|nr:Bridging integrator 2 [Merluccius polli]